MAGLLDTLISGYATGAGLLAPNDEDVKMRPKLAKALLEFLPGTGDAISGYDAVQSARQGNYGEAALNGLGVLPFIPAMGGMINKVGRSPRLISSQRYLDEERVLDKLKNNDFTVRVSKPFTVGDETFQSIEDGHHALEAARRAGKEPKIITQSAKENDRIGLIDQGKIDDFLEASYIDSDWYDVKTGVGVW